MTPAQRLAAALAAIAAVLAVKVTKPPVPPTGTRNVNADWCAGGMYEVLMDTSEVRYRNRLVGNTLYVQPTDSTTTVAADSLSMKYQTRPDSSGWLVPVCVPKGTKIKLVSSIDSVPADTVPVAVAGFNHCQTVEQVFYAGDSLFYVRPLGSASRDSLVKADSTTDTKSPYGPQVLVCNDSVKAKSREVINSGFGRISQAMRNAPNIGTLERDVVPSLYAGPITRTD